MASRLYGNWSGLKKLSKSLDKNLISASKKYYSEQAQKLAKAITEYITGQEGSWEGLKAPTIAKKGDSRILIDTGQLANSIESLKISDLDYVVAPMGNHSSGLSNSELAEIHEYGTDKITPRPFIRPVYEEHKGEVEQGMVAIVGKEIAKFK